MLALVLDAGYELGVTPVLTDVQKTVAPYGSWSSPITSDAIVATSVALKGVFISDLGDFWLEGRPEEGVLRTLSESSCLPENEDLQSTVPGAVLGGSASSRTWTIWQNGRLRAWQCVVSQVDDMYWCAGQLPVMSWT